MSKLAVVFWSGTGNTETMADAVVEGAEGAGAEVEKIAVADWSGNVADYDALALGCPAMGDEQLEEDEFEPFFEDIEGDLSGKKVGLFGSYDWGTGDWMETWKERAEGDDADVVDTVIANLEPDDDALASCKALGAALA
ncbi:flavodoxin [uncultured Parolsenella sp.]|uniref:flavodoxin n=1 Tax=uncultured Parolsenella sp. TaxID=2083008 RepID=UPI0027D99036|nr:flavodoxin [uncultured Parolsenella sp.]